MTNNDEAADAVLAFFKTQWDAEASASGFRLYWDDVRGAEQGQDGNGNPIDFARVTWQEIGTETDKIGPEGIGGDQHEANIAVQLYAEKGDGYGRIRPLSAIVRRFFAGKRVPGAGYFTNASAQRAPDEGSHVGINVTARFVYFETH